MTASYKIGENAHGEEYIQCLRCERKSFNKNDIREKYCGLCGQHPLRAPNHERMPDNKL